ncbi:hypothetical protein POM88_003454 [Heracleum sosnowskyi]|uniref:Uncharacterized protein n=1 Tax=Heracleum sosnowskyi TaxID=360622 RepID=A0AAD8NBN5_9APIA|nr:hypothetical protein POM88_003454 [Heracleum sosnowskyi]
MTLQEAVGSIQSPRRGYESQSRSHDHRTPLLDRTKRSDKAERSWKPRDRSERKFTKLNTDKATILAILKTEPDYRPPRPMKPGRPPSSRYCEYHEDTGHTTDSYFQLSLFIESKIRRGQLVHFIDDTSHPPLQSHDLDRVIDVITGGHSVGGTSNNSKKSYAREVFSINPEAPKKPRHNPTPVISFSYDDYPSRIIKAHQDALVITAKVGTNTVKKILIDNGSSVDILYHHAYL